MQYTFKNNKITFKYMENKETRTDIKKHYKNIEKEEKIECRAKVIFDTSEKMDKVKDETVQLIVTSPPYWDLKNYYKQNQIAKEDYGTYSKRIETVWRECYKKLKKDGSLWININVRVRNNIVDRHEYVLYFLKVKIQILNH